MQRLLLNAEPFGFGPTAAIATIMPHLKPHCQRIGYVGAGHTFDLQRSLPYDAFYTLDDVPWGDYDTFVTALDFGMAQQALQHGLKVAIYDPLTWYWPALDDCIKDSLYIAQAFYGVKERLAREADRFGQVRVVPPLVTVEPQPAVRTGVLVNLGGLQNPFWPLERVQTYALAMARAIRTVVPTHEPITLTTSAQVAAFLKPKLDGVNVVSLPHAEIQEVMARSRFAFMTPGLGNMYDASAHVLPTIWLPPANDSQGQQLDLIRQHGHADGWVDWADLGRNICYTDAQPRVLEAITRGIEGLPHAHDALHTALQAAWTRLAQSQDVRIAGLVGTFGHDGAQHVARAIVEMFKTEEPT